jgi:hypothetical protein
MQPLLIRRFSCLARAALLGTLLGSMPPLGAAHAADPRELCRANSLCPNKSSPSDRPPFILRTLFWAPCGSGPLSLNLHPTDQSGITIAVLNTGSDPLRRLTVNGTNKHDILVGGPGTSETLRGSNGANTYVVGGSNSYALATGDRIFAVATSSETDSVRLTSALPDFIHINTAAQANPGSILTAASPSTAVPVRGSGELSASGLPPCPMALRLPSTLSGAERAQLAQGNTAVPCLPCLNGVRAEARPFPGVTDIIGLDLDKRRGDRLILPAEGYLFQGKSLAGEKRIPILVVDRMPVGPGRVVSEEEFQRLRLQAKGLRDLRSDSVPLLYFRQSGLLLFSQNGDPLGSSSNPGRVIARLLDGNGRPLKLPPSADRIYQAGFLSFVPWQGPKQGPR